MMKTALKTLLIAVTVTAFSSPMYSNQIVVRNYVDGMCFEMLWDLEEEFYDDTAALVEILKDEIPVDMVIPSVVYYPEYDVNVPVTRIMSDVIKNCPSLRSVVFPETLYSLRSSFTISYCENLEEVTFGKNLNSIGTGNPFTGVPKLRTINVPANSTYFASYDGAVYAKDLSVMRLVPPAATSVSFASECVEIGQAAMQGCAQLKEISLPASIKTVGNYAFMECGSLREFVMPETLENVGASLFENCFSLERVVMNSHCNSVSIWMFLNCTSLQEVEIGENVGCVYSKAFAGCGNLKKIKLLPTTPPSFKGEGWFDKSVYTKCVLEVPYGTGALYRNAEVWKNFVKIVDPAEATVADGLKAEYFIDVDPGTGKAEMIEAEVGVNDWRLPLAGVEAGAHIFGIRVTDQAGTYTATVTLPLYVSDERLYSDMEYYVDTDPGEGRGVRPDHQYARTVTFDVATDALSIGAHTLSVRVMDNNGKWTDVMTRPFIVTEGVAEGDSLLEYFYDTDPGIGKATQVNVAAGKNTLYLPIEGSLEAGAHIFGVRCRDNDDNWTATVTSPFYVMPSFELSEVEYFVDADPGEGNGNGVAVDGDGRSSFTVPTAALECGEHTLTLRGLTPDNQWVELFRRSFEVKSEETGVAGIEWKSGLTLALRDGLLTVQPGGFPAGTMVEVYTPDALTICRVAWTDPESPLTMETGTHKHIIVRAITPEGKTVVNSILR